MKKASKYDNMFDKMREVLIEYATAKDEQGRWLHKTPEIMRKFGFGDDPKVIDGFNRWLNRQGIYRCPKPRRSERIPETLFDEVETVDIPQPDTDPGEILPWLGEIDRAIEDFYRVVTKSLHELFVILGDSNE